MNQHRVPGLSIAIIRDARVLWTQGFGVKSVNSPDTVTADTVFDAASLSKPAFAYVVLKLCEQRRLNLDTPLIEYVTEPLIANEPRMRLITARRVLSHTAGLPHGRRRRSPLALSFTPGERFLYSPLGYQYLQMAVERVTNEPFARLMRRTLLEPFGMRDSSFEWLPRYERATAQGHDDDGEIEPSAMERFRRFTAEERAAAYGDMPEARYFGSAAGLYTTAGDYAKFMIEIIRPSRADDFHLSQTTEMLASQIRITDAVSWGLGWGIERTNAGDAFWHWGDWGVFRNFAVAFKPERIGVVILTNSFYGPRVYREIVPQAIGGAHPAFSWIES